MAYSPPYHNIILWKQMSSCRATYFMLWFLGKHYNENMGPCWKVFVINIENDFWNISKEIKIK